MEPRLSVPALDRLLKVIGGLAQGLVVEERRMCLPRPTAVPVEEGLLSNLQGG